MKATLPMKSSLLMTAVVAAGIVAAACAPEGDPGNPPGDSTQAANSPDGKDGGANDPTATGNPTGSMASKPMSKVACLRKMALDLTNAGPALADVDAVRSGGKSLSDMADTYLASPQFSTVVFNWFRATFPPTMLVPDDADKEEPARIARYIVTNDIDFRELVTGDYTVGTNGAKAAGPANAAGVLTTQSYLSAFTGIENRNWARHILSGMTGILLQPVSDVPAGIDASREGLAANPACSNCHTNPIYGVDHAASFHDCYDKSGVAIASCTPKQTSFLGQNGTTIPDLGKILTNSVEWRATMIQTFYVRLGGRPAGKNELPQYRDSEAAWMAAGYKPKALIKQMVTSGVYCSH